MMVRVGSKYVGLLNEVYLKKIVWFFVLQFSPRVIRSRIFQIFSKMYIIIVQQDCSYQVFITNDFHISTTPVFERTQIHCNNFARQSWRIFYSRHKSNDRREWHVVWKLCLCTGPCLQPLTL